MKSIIRNFIICLFALNAMGQSGSEFKRLYANASENGQYDAALKISEKWKSEDSTNTDAFYYSALANLKKGRKPAARQNIETALRLDSMHVPSLLILAKMRSGSGKNALPVYERLIIADPENAYFYREAAETAMGRGKFDRAFAYYTMAYELDSLDAETLGGMAQLFMQLRRFGDADSMLTLALKLDPENYGYRMIKAKMAFDVDKWEDALALTSNDLGNGSQPIEYRIRGISLYHLGRYDESLYVLRELSNRNIELDYPHYYMGLCLEKTGQTERAEVQYGQAVNKALSPNLGTFYERLGLMNQENGNHAKAIENLKMAKHYSGRSEILYHLARSYDSYYQDPSIALNTFEEFVSLADSSMTDEINYANARISQLKKTIHFSD